MTHFSQNRWIFFDLNRLHTYLEFCSIIRVEPGRIFFPTFKDSCEEENVKTKKDKMKILKRQREVTEMVCLCFDIIFSKAFLSKYRIFTILLFIEKSLMLTLTFKKFQTGDWYSQTWQFKIWWKLFRSIQEFITNKAIKFYLYRCFHLIITNADSNWAIW